MPTKTQIEPNRASALLISGPVTEEGPATSPHSYSLSSKHKPRKIVAPDDGYVKRCKQCLAIMTDRRRTYCSAACTRLALTENSKFIVPPSVSPRASFVRNPYRRRWS